jgi:hypothetical protein
MNMEKKAYRRPQLVEYGRLAEVTQGIGGHKQDNGWFHNNNGCVGLLIDCGPQHTSS